MWVKVTERHAGSRPTCIPTTPRSGPSFPCHSCPERSVCRECKWWSLSPTSFPPTPSDHHQPPSLVPCLSRPLHTLHSLTSFSHTRVERKRHDVWDGERE